MHMFRHLAPPVLVTGPHRSGTTICAEMVAHDMGVSLCREEAIDFRDVIKAEQVLRGDVVLQAPYMLPWLPYFESRGVSCVVMMRPVDEIQASVDRLKVSKPFFSAGQAYALLARMNANVTMVEYHDLKTHPLWVDGRKGWGHRQTKP